MQLNANSGRELPTQEAKAFMRITKILFVTAATAMLTSTGWAANYKELVRAGYRWAAADGPFAWLPKAMCRRS